MQKYVSLTPTQAKVFAISVVSPAQTRKRVVEEFEPDRRTMKQTTTIDVAISRRLLHSPTPELLYIPAVIAEKGDLHDDLQMSDEAGEPLQWLSYREYVSLVANVLHFLLLSAYKLNKDDELPEPAKQAELVALQTVMHRRRDQAEAEDHSGADTIANLHVKDNTVRDLASLFVRRLVAKYVVVACVEFPCSRRARFSYSLRRIPPVRLTLSENNRWSPIGLARLGLGARPVALTIDISNACTSQSYHLHLNCPDDLFLAEQEAIGMDDMLRRHAEQAPTLPHCRFRRRLGQAHAHFYARYMPIPIGGREHPMLRFRFFEVPPGSTLRAAVTAFACAAIVWLVGFMTSRYSIPDTDAPAFLLAYPALAAAWLGFESSSQRLLEGTLSARLCLIFTAVLSIASSGLFMAHKTNKTANWPPLPDNQSLLGVTQLDWAIIVTLAVLNASVIGYKCAVRTWEYSRLLVKQHS